MNGIFLLDKPLGISSNHALQKVKRLFNTKKAGHTGTLDPMASGMLPIALGEATKFSQHLLDADKTYSVTMQLGVRTTTSDAEGEIISTCDVPPLSITDIDSAFDAFRGTINQIPSMFSALKHNGVPLYEYARKGITIDRPARPITIYDITILSLENNYVNFTVRCSKGTYVRTLVDDVGEKLQCGAHVTRLRRLCVTPFLESGMMTLEQLTELTRQPDFSPEKILLPMDAALDSWPIVLFSSDEVHALLQGKQVSVAHDHKPGDCVRLLDQTSGAFFGVGRILDDGKIQPQRLVSKI